MRLASALVLLAGLGAAAFFSTAGRAPVTPAAAQTTAAQTTAAPAIPGTELVRVETATGAGVNVRSAPDVRPNNVVARASSGDLLRVESTAERDGFTWYRIATLPDASPAYGGWIRGDLLTPVQPAERTLAEVLAETDNRPSEPITPPTEPAPLPFKLRTDWSRSLLALYPAIEDCVQVNSAPPVTVLRATLRNRGLVDVIMSDSAGRRWDCVIRQTGGTPIRYDPLSGSVYMRDRIAQEPFFSIEEERPRLNSDCYRFERVTDPATEAHLGWLYYRICS